MDTLVHIGIDIGQVQDPTAIAVVEVQSIHQGVRFTRRDRFSNPVYDPVEMTMYTIRHIQRLPLRMSYPTIASTIADVLESERIRHFRREVWVDITGVGRPVFQMIEEQVQTREFTRKVHLHPTTFVHGDEYDRRDGKLGKGYLVSRLQSVLQNNCLQAPDTEEIHALIEELKIYERRLSATGTDTYGAFRSGFHDDLATALGLACLEDPEEYTIRPLDPEVARYFQDWRGY